MLPIVFGAACSAHDATGGKPTDVVPAEGQGAPPGPSQNANTIESPHAQALALVWTTQSELIRSLEQEAARRVVGRSTENTQAGQSWWFDTIPRHWEVSRPIAPGIFDTTHWFFVALTIGDRFVASWNVNTEEDTVQVAKNTLDSTTPHN